MNRMDRNFSKNFSSVSFHCSHTVKLRRLIKYRKHLARSLFCVLLILQQNWPIYNYPCSYCSIPGAPFGSFSRDTSCIMTWIRLWSMKMLEAKQGLYIMTFGTFSGLKSSNPRTSQKSFCLWLHTKCILALPRLSFMRSMPSMK